MSSATLEPKATTEDLQAFPSRHRFNVDEFHAMIEAGILAEDDRLELFNGEIIQMSPTGPLHASCTAKLNALFAPHAQAALMVMQNPLRLSVSAEVYPDFLVLKPADNFYADRIPNADDALLVVEVSDSTLKFDRTPKLARYAEAGVPEVWIVDLKGERVLTHKRPLDGVYGDVNEYKSGDSLEVVALENASFNVDDILP